MRPKMTAGIEAKSIQTNHDKIANTKLQIASGSVRAAVAAVDGGAGGIVSSAIAPL